MQAIAQFSINGKNATRKLHRDVAGMVTDFDTGHRYIKWADGLEDFQGPSRRAFKLSEKTISTMRALVTAGIC